MQWEEIKSLGNKHYKTGSIEPIDLLKASGALWNFALGCIIKYAYRCLVPSLHSFVIKKSANSVESDMNKVIHYANMILAIVEEERRDAEEASIQL